MILNKIKKCLPLGTLFLISIFVYRVWISFSLFAFGDGNFRFKEAIRDFAFPSLWGGAGGALIWSYPLNFLFGLWGYMGFGTNVAEKFLVSWPIMVLGPIAGFYLVKKITGSTVAGFVGSLVFTYDTYFLSIDSQGHDYLTLAFVWGMFAFLFFIYLLDSKKKIFIPLTSLFLFITAFCDLRSLYIVIGVTFLYFIYNQIFIEDKLQKNLKKNLTNFFSVFLIYLFLSLYWLLPVFKINALTNNEFLSREVFGSSYYNLQNSLAFFYPFWTGKQPTWLYLQKIPMSFWLYPLISFAGLILSNKNKKAIFFGLLALLGIFFTKQEGAPFGFVYTWLYLHLPGFNAFREASKFDFIPLISYSVLFGFFIVFLEKNKNKFVRYGLIFLVALFPLLNTVPLITGEIKALFVPLPIPQNFLQLDEYLQNDKDYSRVVNIDLDYLYNYSTNTHPEIDFIYSIQNFWGVDLDFYPPWDNKNTEGQRIVSYLNTQIGRRLLMDSSVGYIPIIISDKNTDRNIRRDLGQNEKFFKQNFDKISYLKKVNLNLENILLYKMTQFKPHIYLTDERETLKKDIDYQKVDFQRINETEYRISFKNLTHPVYLEFTELYHPDWRIHVGDFSWISAITNKNYFIPNNTHFQNAIRFNEFLLDPAQICKNNPCVVNSDGSYSFDATLYYQPQSYLYLGLIISGTTLIFVVGSIFYLFVKEKNGKKS